MKINFKKYLAIAIRRLVKFWDNEQGGWVQGYTCIAIAIAVISTAVRLMWYENRVGLFGSAFFGIGIGMKCLFITFAIHYGGWESYQGVRRLVTWAHKQNI